MAPMADCLIRDRWGATISRDSFLRPSAKEHQTDRSTIPTRFEGSSQRLNGKASGNSYTK